MAASILQIAYDPALLQLRKIMLEKKGYKVVSGLGNQDGIARARSGQFDVIVIGFSASLRLRQEAIRLLRQTCPNVPIVVLQAHSYEKFPDADFATLSEDPESWLEAVANCLKRA